MIVFTVALTAVMLAAVGLLTLRENRRLRAGVQRFQALVQHSSDVVSVVNRDGFVVYVSESVMRVFGYEASQFIGRRLVDMLDADTAQELQQTLRDLAGEPVGIRQLELVVQHSDGRRIEAEMTITNLLDNPGVAGFVFNTRDISERKELEDQLIHEAFHDSLTKLANRALFKDRVERAMLRRGRDGTAVAVLFLDLDGFKEVNDSLGHAAGDQLLIRVAERLRGSVRPEDTVARFGGDEFAVLIDAVAADDGGEELRPGDVPGQGGR
jgi:PAS domain S-box-containing protein